MDLFIELNRLMVEYHFKPTRKMAQNFIIDSSLVESMISHASLSEKDVVLEVGAGTGFLTKELQKKCRVIAVELDSTLCELLRGELGGGNIEIIEGDFLSRELPHYNKVVALPPYTVSSKIVYKLLEQGFELAVLVFQKEFVQKLTAKPGFVNYGCISVITQYYCEPHVLVGNISPTFFYPKPSSFSALVKLDYKKRFGEVSNERNFRIFLKSVFRFKNKNLSNALEKAFPFIKQELKLEEAGFKEKVKKLELAHEKVNLVSVQQFVEVFNQLFS